MMGRENQEEGEEKRGGRKERERERRLGVGKDKQKGGEKTNKDFSHFFLGSKHQSDQRNSEKIVAL